MTAQELYDGLARAVEATKPAQEYCFGATREAWWTVCMTKTEWSGWVQALGSLLMLGIALYLPLRQKRDEVSENYEMAKHCVGVQCALLEAIKANATELPGGYRSAIVASRASIATLLQMYSEVRGAILPKDSHLPWMSSQTNAAQFDDFARNVAANNVREEGLEPAIQTLLDSSKKHFDELH